MFEGAGRAIAEAVSSKLCQDNIDWGGKKKARGSRVLVERAGEGR